MNRRTRLLAATALALRSARRTHRTLPSRTPSGRATTSPRRTARRRPRAKRALPSTKSSRQTKFAGNFDELVAWWQVNKADAHARMAESIAAAPRRRARWRLSQARPPRPFPPGLHDPRGSLPRRAPISPSSRPCCATTDPGRAVINSDDAALHLDARGYAPGGAARALAQLRRAPAGRGDHARRRARHLAAAGRVRRRRRRAALHQYARPAARDPSYATIAGLRVSAHFLDPPRRRADAVRLVQRPRVARGRVGLAGTRALQRLLDRRSSSKAPTTRLTPPPSTAAWPLCCGRCKRRYPSIDRGGRPQRHRPRPQDRPGPGLRLGPALPPDGRRPPAVRPRLAVLAAGRSAGYNLWLPGPMPGRTRQGASRPAAVAPVRLR